jgi:hypothetical protein
MRKSALVLVGACFILINLTPAQAWIFGKKKTESQPATEEVAAEVKSTEKTKPAPISQTDKARSEELKAKKAQAQRKLGELNNTEWAIDLTLMTAKGKKETDVISFKNNQVSVAGFAKKGFPTTNFTLTVQEDGTLIWETMQTSEKSGIAFWRGELDPKMQTMRGVVSHQIDPNKKQDYSFVSTAKKNIPTNQ